MISLLFPGRTLLHTRFRGSLVFVDELPKAISGKIRKVELRSREAEAKENGLTKELEYFYEKL